MAGKKRSPTEKGQHLPTRQDLEQDRRDISRLAGDQALTRILDAPLPATLIQSFDEVDFRLLIHEIGPADALPVLALASDRQIQYLLDAETWQWDRLDNAALTRWMAIMVQADPGRMIPYLARCQPELVEYFLWHNVETRIRQHDQDPSEFGDDCFTLDNVFYLRILRDLSLDAADGEALEDRDRFIRDLIERLADYDYPLFRGLLIESTNLIPAEYEEEALRKRTARLAEKGFLPFEEAVGVYQPLNADQFSARSRKHFNWKDENGLHMPVPCYAAGAIPNRGIFAEALAIVAAGGDLTSLEAEFAGLCNRIAVADRLIVHRRGEIDALARKAAGYLDIALEMMARVHGQVDANAAAALVGRHTLGDIFRVGYGAALKLKWMAENWQRQSWYRGQGLKLAFWDETWMGVLGGLLIKRPLFFDNYRTGVLYREFAGLEDIHRSRSHLENIKALDALLARMDLSGQPIGKTRGLTWKNLLLTLWARECTGRSGAQLTIGIGALGEYLAGLKTARGRIRTAGRRNFLQWLAKRSRQPAEAVSDVLAAVFEALFQELEAEYGRVDTRRLDRRLVRLFLVV